MTMIVGLFDYYVNVQRAIDLLTTRGYKSSQISAVVPRHADLNRLPPGYHREAPDAAAGGAQGGTVRSPVEQLGVEGADVTFPGIGQATATGNFREYLKSETGTELKGTRGMAEALQAEGIPADRAEVYAEGVKRGGILLGVETGEPAEVRDILLQANAADVEAMRKKWEATGWHGFDANNLPDRGYPSI